MAGGTVFLNVAGDYATKNAAADAAARSIAAQNGYTHGVSGTTVEVDLMNASTATHVRVDITGKHANNFAALFGMPTWDVSVTATVLVSDQPNGAYGVMPLLFNEDAFPGAICDPDSTGCTPEVYPAPLQRRRGRAPGRYTVQLDGVLRRRQRHRLQRVQR